MIVGLDERLDMFFDVERQHAGDQLFAIFGMLHRLPGSKEVSNHE